MFAQQLKATEQGPDLFQRQLPTMFARQLKDTLSKPWRAGQSSAERRLIFLQQMPYRASSLEGE